MANEHKTTIRLEIDKTIQPKQFEPIKVIVDVEESFTWTDEKDRAKKMKSYTDKMAEDFVTIYDRVAKRIGEDGRCIGRVITGGDIPVQGKEEVATSVDNDEEWDFS
jgi:hypothetical protein